MPRVSVVTPSFNHGVFLGERISSILEQTFQDFEWVIVDDCSRDQSREILQAAARRDSRIRLFINERNLGMAATVRSAIERSSGEYIFRAESDDSCDRRLLERMVQVLDANPTVGLVHCRALHMDERGALWGGIRQRRTDRVSKGLEVFRSLVLNNYISGSNVMFTRRAHDDVGGFGTGSFQSACDYHFSLLVCLKYDIAYIGEALGFHRSHGNNLSGTVERTLDLDFLFRENSEVLLDVFSRIPAGRPDLLALRGPALRSVTRRAVASAYVDAKLSGKTEVARELIERAEHYDPGGTTGAGWFRACIQAACFRRAYRFFYMPTARVLQFDVLRRRLWRTSHKAIEP
jgi:glycosyltransferase involved in cell wall biosynthesis